MSTEQRRQLADKLCDAGNVASGALIFGQFLGDARYSTPLGLLGVAAWLSFGTLASMLTQEELQVIGLYIMLGGMVLVAGAITVLDWYARHHQRPA